MKIILTTLLITFYSFAYAERFQDNIHSIDIDQENKEHILMLKSGRVAFIDSNTFSSFGSSNFAYDQRVEIEIDKNLKVKSIMTLADQSLPLESSKDILNEEEGEEPTVLPTYSAAREIFRSMNRSYKKKSECSDRAHVWSYEEWLKSGLKTNKVFLFFTNTYIREFRFKWWFHVSPYTSVLKGENSTEYVMDRRYTSYPHLMKNWTDIFIRSKKECPSSTYVNYRLNRYGSEHCFIVRASMFYRLPIQVERMEKYGILKDSFNMSELNFSYRAFYQRYKPVEQN